MSFRPLENSRQPKKPPSNTYSSSGDRSTALLYTPQSAQLSTTRQPQENTTDKPRPTPASASRARPPSTPSPRSPPTRTSLSARSAPCQTGPTAPSAASSSPASCTTPSTRLRPREDWVSRALSAGSLSSAASARCPAQKRRLVWLVTVKMRCRARTC